MSIFTSGRGFRFTKKKFNQVPFQTREHKEKGGCDDEKIEKVGKEIHCV